MLTIFKKVLSPDVGREVGFPKGAEILSCGVQGGSPVLWFLCDPTRVHAIRRVYIVGTGWELDTLLANAISVSEFVGTVNTGSDDYPLMFHIFVGKEETS